MPVKVLVVDDSAFLRQIISEMISEDPEISVVGVARDGVEALAKIAELNPDVLTLDVEMPNMNGLECLSRIMEQSPLPVIMVSYLTVEGAEPTIKALESGAFDFVTKPSLTDPEALKSIRYELILKIKIAAKVSKAKLKVKPIQKEAVSLQNKIPFHKVTKLELMVIGASTGGPKALNQLLSLFPKDFPLGVIIAQHMPKDFTRVFARRLDDLYDLEILEAKSGEEIKPGRVLIAPSGYQTKVVRANNSLVVEVFEQPNLIYKPSVDLLFKSIAMTCYGKVLGVLLTGMGADGAAGLQELRNLGARTIVEAEESCVVFGMPRVAIELGAAEFVESLPNIFPRIIEIIAAS